MPSSLRVTADHDSLLAALDPPIARLAARGVVRAYRKNVVILNEHDPGDSLYVLLEGEVKVYSTDANGREVMYSAVKAGDYFGEMSLDGGGRSASIMTTTPVVCSIVTRSNVQAHLAEEPGFAMHLVCQVIRRARAATDQARRMALMDVYGRVVHMLENEHGPATPQAPVLLTNITHQLIATRVGASREMVSRLLKDLEKGGHIELGIKRIKLRTKLPARW